MRSEWEIGGVSEYCAQLISLGLPNFRKQIGTAEESIKIVIKIVKDYSRGNFSPATRSCRSRTKLRDNRSSQGYTQSGFTQHRFQFRQRW